MKNNTLEKIEAFQYRQLYQNINNRFLYLYAIEGPKRQLYMFDYSKTNDSDFCIVKNEINQDNSINNEDKDFIDRTISGINYDNRIWQKVDVNQLTPQDRVFMELYISIDKRH